MLMGSAAVAVARTGKNERAMSDRIMLLVNASLRNRNMFWKVDHCFAVEVKSGFRSSASDLKCFTRCKVIMFES